MCWFYFLPGFANNNEKFPQIVILVDLEIFYKMTPDFGKSVDLAVKVLITISKLIGKYYFLQWKYQNIKMLHLATLLNQ